MLEIVVIGVAVFGAVAYALGRVEGLVPTTPDDGDDGLPPGRLRPDAVDGARFGLAFRGYRMAEVDRVLDRLRDELTARDAELAVLRPDIAFDQTRYANSIDDSSDARGESSAVTTDIDDVSHNVSHNVFHNVSHDGSQNGMHDSPNGWDHDPATSPGTSADIDHDGQS